MSAADDPVTPGPRPCARKRCGAPAGADAELCAGHEADEKGRVATAVEQLRDRRRREGRCRDCGAKCAKPTRDPDAPYPRCKRCRIVAGRFKAGVVTRMVTKSGSRASKPRDFRVSSFAGEEGRTRFHGKGRRGKPRTGDLDAADLDEAIKSLLDAKTALAYARTPEMLEAPRIQREEAVRAAWSLADLGLRFVGDAMARNRYDSRILKVEMRRK